MVLYGQTRLHSISEDSRSKESHIPHWDMHLVSTEKHCPSIMSVDEEGTGMGTHYSVAMLVASTIGRSRVNGLD
jgi:hypothetical protein